MRWGYGLFSLSAVQLWVRISHVINIGVTHHLKPNVLDINSLYCGDLHFDLTRTDGRLQVRWWEVSLLKRKVGHGSSGNLSG